MLAGLVDQVNFFETWPAEPRVVPSTDPAGIGYYAPSKSLFLADSEIDENVEFTGHNVFQIGRDGKSITGHFWPGSNPEPTGITWNETDGFFYVTNDDEKTVTRFDENLDVPIGSIDARRLGVNDPEDITAAPDGLLYMVSGHPPLVSVFDSHFNFIRTFDTSAEMQDAEGIAYNGQNEHLYLVSAVDQAIFEYTSSGVFVDEYSLSGLVPPPETPQGLAFGPCTDDSELNCLYVADGGRDNDPDGAVYELRLGETAEPYYTTGFAEERYLFGPIPENAIRGRVIGTVLATDNTGKKPSYSIIGGNVEGKFHINAGTGLITLFNGLDYEAASSYTLVVKAAFSGDTVSAMVEVEVFVADIVTEISLPDTTESSFQYGVHPTTNYVATQDTRIRGDFPSNNYGSSNRLEFDGKPDMAALLKWDISSIPAQSSVTSAAIAINVTNTSVDQFKLFELLQPWSEDGATFIDFSTGSPWQVPGGNGPTDRGVLVLGTVTAPALGTATIQLNEVGVAVIQGWVTDPTRNHGLAFQDFSDARTDDLVFSAKEVADPLLRPKLTIEYSPRLPNSIAWTNPENANDANGDTAVTPSDALIIINRLNQFGMINLSKDNENRAGSGYYPDVTGDGMIAPLDALVVINFLNPAPDAEAGDGEAPLIASYPLVASLFDSPSVVGNLTQIRHSMVESSADEPVRKSHQDGQVRVTIIPSKSAIRRQPPPVALASDVTSDEPFANPLPFDSGSLETRVGAAFIAVSTAFAKR